MRKITLHDQARDANGAIDAAPSMTHQIKHHKEILGKESRRYRSELACMANGLKTPRQKRAKFLVFKLRTSSHLASWQCANGVPAFARMKDTRTHDLGHPEHSNSSNSNDLLHLSGI